MFEKYDMHVFRPKKSAPELPEIDFLAWAGNGGKLGMAHILK
jgi:hypothetical protein